MVRLCLLLLSCCLFRSYANNLISDIIQAIEGIKQLDLPSEVLDYYFEVPIKSTTAHLNKYVKSLKFLKEDCMNSSICTDDDKQLRNYLSKIMGNLHLLKKNRSCSDDTSGFKVKEVKLIKFLHDLKLFLHKMRQNLTQC